MIEYLTIALPCGLPAAVDPMTFALASGCVLAAIVLGAFLRLIITGGK